MLIHLYFISVEQTRLDPLVDIVSSISTEVDDLICSLYSPVNIDQAVVHGKELSSILNQLLEKVKGIANEEDKAWIELLTKAVRHNLHNLESKAATA